MEAVRHIIDAELLPPSLSVPRTMRHGQVEVLIFPAAQPEAGTAKSAAKKSDLFPDLGLDMTGFKFDREEANAR